MKANQLGKPRIKYSRALRAWGCFTKFGIGGFGLTPADAYRGWEMGNEL